MSYANDLIARFGGQTKLAEILGTRQSTVQHWAKVGVIPYRWHRRLAEAAEKLGILLPLAVRGTLQAQQGTEQQIPIATHFGDLPIGAAVLPCYRLSNGERVFSLKGVVVGLIGIEGGPLAEYVKVKSIRDYLPADLRPGDDNSIPALIKFDTGGSDFTKFALGLPVEKFIDLCAAYSDAADDPQNTLSERQMAIATTARRFLRATAKVGIIALVDEATGYQDEREEDALQLKMRLFLAEEMREWEKTFPDELWVEFGRLTNWSKPAHLRPKYWGHLVNELVYGYLDPDVAQWLKTNAPSPRHGQNYHQWLSGQYGLKKLIEHIWMLIGMARSCSTMIELRQRMAEQYGRHPVQLTLFVSAVENQR